MSVCAFNSLPSREYSSLLVLEAFSSTYFSGKTNFPVKNSYLPTFLMINQKYLQFVCLNCIELCFALLSIALIFSVIVSFITSSS